MKDRVQVGIDGFAATHTETSRALSPESRRAVSRDRITPALGLASLAFGVWYALGALTLVPYAF